MRDRKNAIMMLALAKEDLALLEVLREDDRISNRLFGFHAQQAVEKALKAWLALAGVDYPKIHDLQELLAILAGRGEAVSEGFMDLRFLTPFAVLFRYGGAEEPNPHLERPTLIEAVAAVVKHVERLIGGAGASS
jgi:HEPN domain-containing protein